MVSKKLTFVLLIAFVLRLIMGIPLLSNPERMLQNDSPSYLKVAKNLHEGNGYSNCPQAPFYKDVLRTPTYPIVLAGAKYLSLDHRLVLLVQILLDLLTLIILFRIGRHFFSEGAGLIAAGFYAVSVINVVMCAQVLAETTFIFLTISSLYFISVQKKYWLSGVWLGLAVLCKPIGLYLFVFYLIHLVVMKVGIKPIVSFVIPFAMLVGGWMVRNQQITNTFTISSISSYSLFAYNSNMVLAHQSGKTESILREERISQVYEKTKGELGDYSGEFDYVEVFDREAKKIILDNLGLYSYLHLKNSFNSLIPGVHYVLQLFGKTEGGRGTMNVLRREGIFNATKFYFSGSWGSFLLLIPWILIWLVMILAAALGGFKSLRNKNWEVILLLVVTGLYFLFISGPAAEPRFGALVTPYFCLLGGFYLVSIDRIKNWL